MVYKEKLAEVLKLLQGFYQVDVKKDEVLLTNLFYQTCHISIFSYQAKEIYSRYRKIKK